MKIAFKVDASFDIGSGHVMRCLTLAAKLFSRGHKIIFICRKMNGDLGGLIKSRGFELVYLSEVDENIWAWMAEHVYEDLRQTAQILLKENYDLLIIDHYSIDESWENGINRYVDKIMVIDDLANRKHKCDILLDHNFYLNASDRYKKLISSKVKLLVGPSYALLNDDYFSKEERSSRNLVITFGGSDPTNETEKVLNILFDLPLNHKVRVIVGANNKNNKKIENLLKEKENYEYLYNIHDMSKELRNADFVIGAGGVSALERLALGIPSILITVAENQIEIAKNLASAGVVAYLGYYKEIEINEIKDTIQKFIKNENYIIDKMKKNCQGFFPNYNTTEAVVEKIEELFL